MKRIFLGWKSEPFPRYMDAIRTAGATVEREKPDNCDALLLPGGGDLHPRLYGQPIDGADEINEQRDQYEIALFRYFFEQRKPIFGICRGLQLINVALGGTLYQHIENHRQSGGGDMIHFVKSTDPDLVELYGNHFPVNSFHHQAVDRLGNGLFVCAKAEDGTIEAVKHDSLPVFAVQWHPERLRGVSDGLLLFSRFIDSL